jgi:hypothetical protein
MGENCIFGENVHFSQNGHNSLSIFFLVPDGNNSALHCKRYNRVPKVTLSTYCACYVQYKAYVMYTAIHSNAQTFQLLYNIET